MIRKLLVGIVIILAVGGGLAAVKTMQIKTMIAMPRPQVVETIASAVAREEQWPETLPSVGSVSAAQGVLLAPEISGKVSEIAFESGAKVNQGDVLVKLDTSSEVAQLNALEAQADLAKLTAERLRKLAADKAISQSELDQAEAALKQANANADTIRATIAKKTIRAPFTGRLGIRLINLGEQVDPSKSIVSLQAPSPMFVDFSLPQQNLSQLATGLKVRATTDAYVGTNFIGEISAINPDLDAVSRSVRVRATFANADERLRAGMFVSVEVLLAGSQTALVVPATSLFRAPYSDSVFLLLPATNSGSTNLIVEQKFITTGRTHGDFVSVESGLHAGDKVATEGIFKLRTGMTVAENNGLVPAASENPTPPNN